MGDLDKPNWSLSKGTKLPALCMSPKPRLCHIWRVFGQAGALIHPTCTEQGIRIQSRETTGWVAHAEEKSPQPAKATLAAPTQPLWVLTSVSGSSTLLWRWVRWTRPGPGTMLSDSALQSLQGLCTKGTLMVLALRGAFRTLCGYLSSRLVCPYTPRKRSNQASPHPSFLGILPLPSPPGYKESLC